MMLRYATSPHAVASLLVLCLLLCVSAGCGGGSDAQDPAEGTSVVNPSSHGTAATNDPASGPEGSLQPPAPATQPAPPATPAFDVATPLVGEGYTLRWASWQTEDGARSTDVSAYIRELMEEQGRVLWDPDTFNAFAGDPAPGEEKWLVMVVDTPTRVLRIALQDHSNVYFTVPPNRSAPHGSGEQWGENERTRAEEMLGPDGFEGVGVVWARWGNDGRGGGWADATAPVSQQLDESPRIVNKTHNIGVPARSRHRRKTLRMLLSVDGQPLDLHFRLYSHIVFEPTPEQLAQPVVRLPGPAPELEPEPEVGADYIVAEAPPDVSVTRIVVSADGSVVYALDPEQRSVMKLDGRTLEVLDAFDNLPEGVHALALSRDGETLYLGGPVNGFDRGRSEADFRGQIVQVQTQTMSPVGRNRQVRVDIRELFVAHDGNLLALNGSGNSNSFVAVIDPRSGAILGKNDWADPGAAYALHPDGQRLYNSNSNRTELRWLDPDNEPGVTWNFAARDHVGDGARGPFALMDAGRHMLVRDGSLLRVSNHHPRGLLGIAQLAPNAGGAIARDAGIMAVSVGGGMQLFSWPGLTPLGETFHDGVVDGLIGAPVGTLAYGWHRPRGELDRFGRTGGGGAGTLVAIDLARAVPEGFEPEPSEVAPIDDEDENIAQRLPLRTEVGALLLSPNRDALYTLDTAGGVVHRLDAQTLEVLATSEALPAGTHRMALNITGDLLAVAAAPSGFHSNKDREAGTLLFLDPVTLRPRGRAVPSPVDPCDIAFDHTGGLIVSGGSNQSTHILRIDPNSRQDEEISRSYMGTAVCITPDGTLLFTATNGLSPASMEARHIERDGTATALPRDQYDRGDSPHGSDMWTTGDGRFTITAPGGVFESRFSRKTAHIRGIGSLEPLTGAAGHGTLLLVADRTNTLGAYRLPGLQPMGQALFDGLLEHLCYDPAARRLYAVFYPGRRMGGHAAYQGPVRGDIVVIDIATLLGE